MKRSIFKKLRSNEGASLTFAILLFLVCAVAGAIILTAGTIASGRLADKAKMDQRYYHVVSTAEFFKDILDGKQVVIIREKDSSGTTLKVEGYDDDNHDFLTARTLELLSSNDWDADFFNTTDKISNFKFQLVNRNDFETKIKATVTNGRMYLDISDDDYTVRMTFGPAVAEVITKDEEVETKTSTVTWHVNNIEKVFAKDWIEND